MNQRNATHPTGVTTLQVVCVIILIVGLLVILSPMILRPSRPAHRAQAINNAREIGTALIGFVEQYGGYPSEETKQQLVNDWAEVIPEGNDANSYLAQLLASGAVDSEKIFYVKGLSTREGDNIFSTPEKMLAQGENGFGYVMLEGDEPLHSPGSTVPLILAPLTTGGSNPKFDPKPFRGYYIYLTPDGAVSTCKISEDGTPLQENESTGGLFDSGKDSVFGSDIPDVKMPR